MPRLRLLHIALCLSAIVITVTLGVFRSFGPAATGSFLPVVPLVVLGFAVTTIAAGAVLRTTIPALEGTDEEGWATANLQKCVMLWAVLEGGVAICAVALFLGANPWMAGAIAAGGLGFLASQSPGTLAGH